MLIKQKIEMTERERIAAENSNNKYLESLAYVSVGTVFPYAGTIAPDTFMFCDGSELDTTEYAELFNVIGYTFGGEGDVFNLPDLRGKTLVGASEDYAVGSSGGAAEVTLTTEEIPEHAHNVYSLNVNSEGYSIRENYFNSPYAIDYTSTTSVNNKGYSNAIAVGSAGEGLAHENMPPYTVINYIIKVKAQALSEEYKALLIDQTYNPQSENAQSGIAVAEAIAGVDNKIGDISTALDELHTYAQALVSGGASE